MIDPSELTAEQQKAFESLKRALKKCEKANIYWYQNLETLYALNGNVVYAVEPSLCTEIPEGAFPTEDFGYINAVKTTCSFADDTHYVVYK